MAALTGPIDAIVTDIEGTTSSIAFVHDVLFPYARSKLPEYVVEQGPAPAVRAALDEAKREAGDVAMSDAAIVVILLRWIDEDRKATPLKTLQGLIWADGYRTGAFQGHVYPDAADALRQWHARGMALYVYSSGSVAAQKQIFSYSPYGDLTPLFAGYFDTTTGAKKEAESYRKIAAAIRVPVARVLFLSDSIDEIAAARAAGLQTVQLRRPGESQPKGHGPEAAQFGEIDIA